MHVLISGGTGFIGQKLTRSLLDEGHAVSILTRDRDSATRLFGAAVSPVQDVSEIADDASIQAIINLAGAPIAAKRWSPERKKLLMQSRIGTTQSLVQLVERLNTSPQCFVSGSAVGYYGDQGDQVVTEDSEPHDEFSHQLCSAWEQTAQPVQDVGVRLCTLRTGLVVGAGGGFLQQMLLPFKFGLGGRLGSGEQWMPWVHMDDLIALIHWFISDQNCKGAYNGTAPTPVTNREFTETLASVLKRPALLPVPAAALRLLMGEMSDLLLTGQRAVPQRALDAGFDFSYAELRPALEEALNA